MYQPIIRHPSSTSGAYVYMVVQDPNSQQYWNGVGFEVQTDANWANYAVHMPEQGHSAVYTTPFPIGILLPETYTILAFERLGAQPAMTDKFIGGGPFQYHMKPFITGYVAAPGASTQSFVGSANLDPTVGVYTGMYVVFTGGQNQGAAPVKVIQIAGLVFQPVAPLPYAPAQNDPFMLIGRAI